MNITREFSLFIFAVMLGSIVSPTALASNECAVSKGTTYSEKDSHIPVIIEKAMAQTPEGNPLNLDLKNENPNLRIFYNSKKANQIFKTPLLDFSWYLVGKSKHDLERVRAYLIENHKDRPQHEFDLKPLNGVFALMIFDEMISRQSKLQEEVRKYRQETDSDFEREFWKLSDPKNPSVAILSYSSIKSGNTRLYFQTINECMPFKFLKLQLFAIANHINNPKLKTYFDGENRVIEYNGRKIWPSSEASMFPFYKDLLASWNEPSSLNHIDRSLFRLISPENPDAKKYEKALEYLRPGQTITHSFVDMKFYPLLKELAVLDAKAQYEKEDFAFIPMLATTRQLIRNLADPYLVKLFAGIIYREDVRNYLRKQCEAKAPWAKNENYSYRKYQDQIIDTPIYDAMSSVEILNAAGSSQLEEIFEVAFESNKDRCFSNALLAFQSKKLSDPLLKDDELNDMLRTLTQEQLQETSRTINTILDLERLFKLQEAPVVERINKELKVIDEIFSDVILHKTSPLPADSKNKFGTP